VPWKCHRKIPECRQFIIVGLDPGMRLGACGGESENKCAVDVRSAVRAAITAALLARIPPRPYAFAAEVNDQPVTCSLSNPRGLVAMSDSKLSMFKSMVSIIWVSMMFPSTRTTGS